MQHPHASPESARTRQNRMHKTITLGDATAALERISTVMHAGKTECMGQS
jgi:hypothetical protein